MENIVSSCDINKTNARFYSKVSTEDRITSKLETALNDNAMYVTSVTNTVYSEEDLNSLAIQYSSVATFLNANVFSIALILYSFYKDETINNFQKISKEILDEVSFIKNKSKIPFYQEALLRYLRLLLLQEE